MVFLVSALTQVCGYIGTWVIFTGELVPSPWDAQLRPDSGHLWVGRKRPARELEAACRASQVLETAPQGALGQGWGGVKIAHSLWTRLELVFGGKDIF